MSCEKLIHPRIVRQPLCALAVAGMAVFAVPAFAQSQTGQQVQKPNKAASGPAMKVTAEKLSDNPENYYGKTVTVKEDVADVMGSHVFTLDDGEFLGTSPDILVVAPGAEAVPNEDSTVTVTGPVRKFTHTELERDWAANPWAVGYGYGWYGPAFGPDYWVRYENRPYIVARSIKTASGRELVSNQQKSGGSGEVGTSGRTGDETSGAVTSVSDLVGPSSSRHDNDRVRLSNVKVERVTSKRAFWVAGENGKELFVALDESAGQPNLSAGEQVSIAGRALRVPSDKTKIDGSKWGLGSEDLTKLLNTHVFIRANAVRTGDRDQSKQ